MQATQISARVNFPEITYDPAVPYQANMASCFARTASPNLVPGNILVLPRYRIETVPPDNNVENIVVPQLFFMVMSSDGVTVYVRTVVSLYGAQNLSPPEDQSFTITGNVNNARGSLLTFQFTIVPVTVSASTSGPVLSGLSLDAFSENFSKTELSYSVNMQQVADRVRDLSRLLTVIVKCSMTLRASRCHGLRSSRG